MNRCTTIYALQVVSNLCTAINIFDTFDFSNAHFMFDIPISIVIRVSNFKLHVDSVKF